MFEIHSGDEMTNKTFRLPVDLVHRLTVAAKGGGVSVNNLVRQCCEYALGEMRTKSRAEAVK